MEKFIKGELGPDTQGNDVYITSIEIGSNMVEVGIIYINNNLIEVCLNIHGNKKKVR